MQTEQAIIHGLSNHAYHFGQPYADYLSSSQLKWYAKSPKYYRYKLDNSEEEKTDALRFGLLFHDLMANLVDRNGDYDGVRLWISETPIFKPPINEKTAQPYGNTTKVYKEAYDAFLSKNNSKEIVTAEEQSTLIGMAQSLLDESSATAKQIIKLLRWGKAEVSHFVEYEGCKFKFRPDLETKSKIVDWKTVSTDDLSERSINTIIAKYGYDISAAFYQFMEHEQSGKWKQFYWVFVSKTAPYDAVMVDASKWAYDYDPVADIVLPQVGAIKMKALLDLHIKCVRENQWPGAEIYIPQADNGLRIMCPTPPAWETTNAANILEYSFKSKPMNDNIDFRELLKGHIGETFYSPIIGEIRLKSIDVNYNKHLCICFRDAEGFPLWLTADGKFNVLGELAVFPSKDQRDWNKWAKEQGAEPCY